MEIYEPVVDNINYCGDLHGMLESLITWVNSVKHSALIVCGDIGLGFNKKGYYNSVFESYQKKLEKSDNYIYFVRGNHDNPSYFVGELTPRIFAVPDYSVIKHGNDNILCVGGAVSIDRNMRIRNDVMRRAICLRYGITGFNQTYWDNEMPVYDEDAISKLPPITVMATHTCPMQDIPIKNGLGEWCLHDPTLAVDVKKERETLNAIWQKLPTIKRWYCGHFHMHWTNIVNGVEFTVLDMCRNGKLDIV